MSIFSMKEGTFTLRFFLINTKVMHQHSSKRFLFQFFFYIRVERSGYVKAPITELLCARPFYLQKQHLSFTFKLLIQII